MEDYLIKVLDITSDEPFLKIANCMNCDIFGKCCYGGVYLTKSDEEKIRRFVKQEAEYFSFLPEKYIVRDVFFRKKTAVKKLDCTNKSNPKYFEKTKCVFGFDSGECSLQIRASELNLHPWAIKPQACWLFPLKLLFNNKLSPPPLRIEPDINFVPNAHHKFMWSLPCCRPYAKGEPGAESWKTIFKHEIEYFATQGKP